VPERKLLHSWKEISNYTGRGVRTIQRYEVKFGFPVHRPAGKDRSAVLAFSDEIDAWLSHAPTRPSLNSEGHTSGKQHLIETERYHALTIKAKTTRQRAEKVFESSVRQAKRVAELVHRAEELQARHNQRSA